MIETDNTTFMVTVLVVGIGGTTVVLGVLAALMSLLKAIFPVRTQADTATSEQAS